jgi:hypothetical protein
MIRFCTGTLTVPLLSETVTVNVRGLSEGVAEVLFQVKRLKVAAMFPAVPLQNCLNRRLQALRHYPG